MLVLSFSRDSLAAEGPKRGNAENERIKILMLLTLNDLHSESRFMKMRTGVTKVRKVIFDFRFSIVDFQESANCEMMDDSKQRKKRS